MSTPIASAFTTAAFNISNEAVDYKNGKCSKDELGKNILWDLADVTVSTLGSAMGAKYITKVLPKKYQGYAIIGTLIGNSLANLVYKPIKKRIRNRK